MSKVKRKHLSQASPEGAYPLCQTNHRVRFYRYDSTYILTTVLPNVTCKMCLRYMRGVT